MVQRDGCYGGTKDWMLWWYRWLGVRMVQRDGCCCWLPSNPYGSNDVNLFLKLIELPVLPQLWFDIIILFWELWSSCFHVCAWMIGLVLLTGSSLFVIRLTISVSKHVWCAFWILTNCRSLVCFFDGFVDDNRLLDDLLFTRWYPNMSGVRLFFLPILLLLLFFFSSSSLLLLFFFFFFRECNVKRLKNIITHAN